jgi:hypothetical protein
MDNGKALLRRPSSFSTPMICGDHYSTECNMESSKAHNRLKYARPSAVGLEAMYYLEPWVVLKTEHRLKIEETAMTIDLRRKYQSQGLVWI